MARLPRYRTGDAEIDQSIDALISQIGDVHDADLVFELMVSAVRLARDRATRGDLKIANAALKEMRYAFAVFEPYRAGAQGRDLRLGPHPARRPAVRADRRAGAASSPTPTGWSSPAPGPGSWRRASRARARPTRSA